MASLSTRHDLSQLIQRPSTAQSTYCHSGAMNDKPRHRIDQATTAASTCADGFVLARRAAPAAPANCRGRLRRTRAEAPQVTTKAGSTAASATPAATCWLCDPFHMSWNATPKVCAPLRSAVP